jgi:sugar-phosphatase
MLKAVIFDMDGVLIDSEPLWKLAEQEVFRKVGIHLNDEMCAQTTGLEIQDTVFYWYEHQPWLEPSQDAVCDDIEQTVAKLIIEKGEAISGVYETLAYFKQKGWKIAVASSSSMFLINTVLKKLNIEAYFDAVHSSEFEKAGKPHPDVYLGAARKLNINPHECLAVEDSFRGVEAAHHAGMKVIAVPDEHLKGNQGFNKADLVLDALNKINDNIINRLENI